MSYGFDEIRVDEVSAGTIITLVFNETITKQDFEYFVPQLETFMASRDKIRLLIELRDFNGITPGALWEDTKFGIRHFDDIERLAIVGDSRWEQAMAGFIKPFTTASVKYFEQTQLDSANRWIRNADDANG